MNICYARIKERYLINRCARISMAKKKKSAFTISPDVNKCLVLVKLTAGYCKYPVSNEALKPISTCAGYVSTAHNEHVIQFQKCSPGVNMNYLCSIATL